MATVLRAEQWPRADEAHIAAEHVKDLRKFVE